jgi:hypothetical protein
MITMSVDDYLWFVDEALDGMISIVTELGDDLANVRPDLPGANSAYVILTHCLGVMAFWGGHAIAGRVISRDRDAEFVAAGRVDELLARVRGARGQLEVDLASLDALAPPRGALDPEDAMLPLGRTQGGVALHLYEELAQHHGQMQVGRDVVVRGRG